MIKDDFSDLKERFKWCENNQEKCKQIIKNARLFMLQFKDNKREEDIEKSVIIKYFNYLDKINKEDIPGIILIGSSNSYIKVISLKKKYSQNTILNFKHFYPDIFSYKFDGDNLIIKRIDKEQGWGQNLIGYLD